MALINCRNCGKQISDKAKVCPQCGEAVILAPAVMEAQLRLCEECGTELPEGCESCPNCGCPVAVTEEVQEEAPQKVEVTSVNLPKMKAGTKKYIVIAVAVVIALAAMLLMGKQNAQKKRLEEYGSDLKSISYTMLQGAVEAEEAGNLIKRVWYNSIYEERDSETDKFTRPNGYFLDDFNDALNNLFSDSDFRRTISSIESNQSTVARKMKELKNPPEEFEDAYDALKDYYDAYTALTNMATNPSGSLQTYSQSFNAADTELVNCYEAMQIYLD